MVFLLTVLAFAALLGGLWLTTNLLSYIASSTLTISLNALATSSTWLVGRQSTAVTNSSNYLDYLLSGFVKVGTTPTISTEIRVYVIAAQDDTPTYPDTFGASDAGVTVTSAGVGSGFLKLAAVMLVDATTTDRVYYFGPVSVASLFGGVVPKKWAAFVTHNSAVNLNASAGGTLSIVPVASTNG